jgi:glutathione synthase/RimK-type ligase-like ATP-grasp enzyme
MRIGLVAPIWDAHAGPLLRAHMDAGRKPVWFSPQGFRFDERGTLQHDDWTRGEWSRLSGLVIASLSSRLDPELFEWRRGLLEELCVAGLPVIPDPRNIQMAWDPTRMLLRLRRAGLAVIDHYVGENLDDAWDFVRTHKGAVFRVPEGSTAPEIEWVSQGQGTRDRLEELWQDYPMGPFVLVREIRGGITSLLVLGGEALAAWRDGTPGIDTTEHVPMPLVSEEMTLALDAARAFGLDPVVIELSRDAHGLQVHGVRALGIWKAVLASHPQLAPTIVERLEALILKPSKPGAKA